MTLYQSRNRTVSTTVCSKCTQVTHNGDVENLRSHIHMFHIGKYSTNADEF